MQENTPNPEPQAADERRGGTSASNAMPDRLCPARHRMQKGIPDQPSKFSSFGDRVHAALFSSNKAHTTLTLAEREVFDQIRNIEKKLMIQTFGQNQYKLFREQRFYVLIDGKHYHSGKPDFVARDGPKGLIIEYKTLPGDVPDAPDNEQLRDQVALAAGHLLLDDVTVYVAQPSVTMDPVPCRYTKADIKRAEAEMFARVRRCYDETLPPVPGKPQCDHCKAKANCVQYLRWAGSMVPAMLDVLEVPVSAWSPQQRAVFCHNHRVAKKWLEETMEAMVEGAKQDPGFIEGFELKPGATRRIIVDPQSVFNRYATLGGTVGKFMGCINIGMTKLREAVNDLTGARGKALDAAMETLLKGLYKEEQNAPSLKEKEK